MLADMASQTEAARQLTYAAAARVDADASDLAYWTSCAKLIAGDTAMRVTTDAVQVLGGYGYITEYPVERMMRDAKITQLYEGTQQIQRLIIARQILQRAGVGASRPAAGAAAAREDRRHHQAGARHHRREALHVRPAARPRLHRVGRQPAGRVRHRAGAAAPGVRGRGRGRIPVDGAGVRRPRHFVARWPWAATTAYLVTDDALVGADEWATATVLAAALDKLAPDVALMGMASDDARGSLVPGAVAAMRGLPLLSYGSELTLGDGVARVRRLTATGFDIVEAPLPVVASVTDQVGEPRYASLKGIMAAKRKTLETWSLADLGLDAGRAARRGADPGGRGRSAGGQAADRADRERGCRRGGDEDRRLAGRPEADLGEENE